MIIRRFKSAPLILMLTWGILFNLYAQSPVAAGEAFIHRQVPRHAKWFRVEVLPPASHGLDTFEIEARDQRVVLRGNNGVAIASAFYHYIKEVVHGQITWNGVHLPLSTPLPLPSGKIARATPHEKRYYLNYCTFNYSMSWWDWKRWEQEIDWMALHGINMPLAITGQEYIWYEVYKDMGLTDDDLSSFFSGPAYFAWFYMGNLDAWGGPLPMAWMTSHRDLQIQILKRQRELGMKPVLPAFTGHVPTALVKRFPQARFKQTNWGNGFADTYILDADDPLFIEIGRRFLERQTKWYGTDHFYSADTFNENEPPSDEPAFLSKLSKRVYESMAAVDPQAVWVMQGWLFYSDRKFWHAPQIKALLEAVPSDHMIILDLATEIEPVWKRTEAFYGKPWIWNMLHNFGGNTNLFGRIDGVAAGPSLARQDAASGKMSGLGLTMEAIEQNPVLYELLTDHTWRTQPINLDEWLPNYLRNRYGSAGEPVLRAWKVLRQTVYNGKDIRDGAESIFQARPTLEPERRWAKTRLNYVPQDLLPAWDDLISGAGDCGRYEGYQYDLVDVTRQVLANYAMVLQGNIRKAFEQKDRAALALQEKAFMTLLDDLDRLLATRPEFLLGRWTEAARRCGKTKEEKDLYERNARNLITLWGHADNVLHEYSCRQWSGLISDFYKPRWQQYFVFLDQSLNSGVAVDQTQFDTRIKAWEWEWVNAHRTYPEKTIGQPVAVSQALYKKYRPLLAAAYP